MRKAPTPPRCSACPPPIPRRIYVPAIELAEAQHTEIVLNSRSPNEMEVTPTFYTESGETILGDPIRLQPAEIRFVRIDSLIPRYHRNNHRWGGMSLSFTGSVLEVWAQITFHGVAGRGSIDETFNILGDQPSDTREAVWWMPRKSTAVIALGNSSDTPIQVTASFSDGESKQINIRPFSTEFIRRRAANGNKESGTLDSVKLTTAPASADAFRIAGFIVGGEKNFDSSIRFADTKKVAQPNLYATNLRLQNTEPHMVLKNTGPVEITARPRFSPVAGVSESPVELPAITLGPNETVDVNLTPLRIAAGTRADLDAVSVNVVNSGAAGSLIGAWYGTDTNKLLTYDVPLRDSGPIRNSTGSYPWRTDQDYTTIVNITNISDHAATFVADIRFRGGHYFIPTNELPAGGTARFDLRKIISEQKPDNQGNVIPLSVTGGQFHWSIFHSPPSSKFIGRSEVISVSKGVGSSYSCPGCCPDSGPFGTINPPPSTTPGNSFTASTTGTIYDGCTGYGTNVGWFQMEFWMDDETIASYTPESGSSTLVTGVKPGDTALHGSYSWQSFVSDGWSICYEDRGESEDQQPVQVKPTITGPTSVWWFNGENPANANMPISIQLTTQTTGSTYSWAATANGSKVILSNETTNTLTLTGNNKSGTAGDVKITVTVNGTASDEYAITVKAPHQLNRTSISHVSSGNFGYKTTITYSIRDQFNNSLGAGDMLVNEKFTTGAVGDFPGMNWLITPDGGNTVHVPAVSDVIEGENLNKNPAPQAPQTPLGSTKVVHWGQDIYIGSDTVGLGRKVQTATFQKYKDHADHENITSPIP
ncbi:MAG TPA: hypothetical protein VFI24_21815 [Pyrinomonadaceae bacterium]|nr:hypothetical protein [Pyrinomonadaceae bacterium]